MLIFVVFPLLFISLIVKKTDSLKFCFPSLEDITLSIDQTGANDVSHNDVAK